MSAVALFRRPSVLAVLTLSLGVAAQAAHAEDYVCFDTNHGDICFDLYPESAPQTVANFLRYVDRGAYDTTLVHRSVPGFVIQGGGFSGAPDLNSFSAPITVDAPIVNESARSNLRGTLAMARTSDPNSATSQWFINLADNTALDGTTTTGYAVFGEVVQGMDVVDAIAALRVGDFRQALNSIAFGEMPVDMAPTETNADFSDFVVVERAYRTERLPGLLPYQCSLTSPGDTLTEFCGSTVTFPVLVDGVLYEATLQYVAGREGLVFSVDRSKLKGIADTGQERATYAAGVLTLPSVRNGSRAFTNVRLNLTSTNPLEFKVDTFTPR
ncbi:MAG: peptidylprolyl isomerase [Gammaproteobacteria bacterium]